MKRLGGWQADITALLAGLLLPLAFAPFAWWPVAIICLTLFWHVIQKDSQRRTLWRAWLFGLGYFGTGVSWVYVSISLFGNATPILAGSITALLIIVLSCYIVLAVYLARKFSTNNLTGLLMLPTAWVAIEWLRGWLFTGFGWLDAGYAFIDTPLAAYGAYIGVLGISFLVLLTVAGLHLLLTRQAHITLRTGITILLLAIWLLPMLITFPVQTTPDGKPMAVALIQGNVPQHRKWQSEERQPTLNMYRQLTEKNWDKQLIIWPETAIPAFEDRVFNYIETLHTAAQISDTRLMIGMPVRESHGDRYYNALAVLGNGDRGPDSLYQKRHLVPFGEYLPLRFMLDPLLSYLKIPMSNFSAGEGDAPLVDAGKYQAGVFICFEIAFGEAVRKALPEAAYLVNISNDAWFGDSLAPPQHLQMARMRAVENGRYVLRATNTGISAIIDAQGKIQKVLPQFKRDVLTGKIQPMKDSTFYARFGDYPLLGLLLIMLVGIGWTARKHGR